jgi:hypothetical protein
VELTDILANGGLGDGKRASKRNEGEDVLLASDQTSMTKQVII